MARLKEYYQKELRQKIKQKFDLKNINEVPKLSKIVLNMGVGEAIVDSKKNKLSLRRFNEYYWSKAISYKSKTIDCWI